MLTGFGLVISGLPEGSILKLMLGVLTLLSSRFLAAHLMRLAEPKITIAEKHHAEQSARKAAKKEKRNNQEQIGFEYLKATFLFAGHIARADGKLCASELCLFDEVCLRLRLNRAQINAVQNYFNEGQSQQFDEAKALNRFVTHCGCVEALCENFLQIQFSFAEASGEVTFPEWRILQRISKRLNAQQVYQDLLEAYRIDAEEKAEILVQQRIDARKRQWDKQREAREKARIEAEQQQAEAQKLAKLTPAQRELRMAFVVLGIKATNDMAVIKRAYREQIKRHHPDYLLSQGYPEELLKEATERSVKINRAYRLLKTRIGFS